MKKSILFVLVLGTLFASCKKPLMDEVNCFMSFEDAKKEAKSTKKDLLVIFSQEEGEANGGSLFFKENILKDQEFIDFAKDNFVLYRMDFSTSNLQKSAIASDKEEISKEEQKLAEQYADVFEEGMRLASYFAVQYMPSFYVLNKDGLYVCQADYNQEDMNTKTFIGILQECQLKSQELNQLVLNTKKGSKEDRINALDTLFVQTTNVGRLFLKDLIKETVKIDAKNKTGLMGKFIYYTVEEKATNYYMDSKFEESVNCFLKATEYSYLDPMYIQQCYYMAAYISQFSGIAEDASCYEYLKKAYEIAPDTEFAQYLQYDIQNYEMMMQNKESKAEGPSLESE